MTAGQSTGGHGGSRGAGGVGADGQRSADHGGGGPRRPRAEDGRGGAAEWNADPQRGGAEERGRVLRLAGAVGAITLISRIAGYLRDRLVAHLLGTELAADAWTTAFRLPNTFRRMVGEGNVSAAFVPVFSEELGRRERPSLWHLAESFHTGIGVVAGALTVLGILAAPWLIRYVLVPGFDSEAAFELTTYLTRLCFPYLLFIALAAALMGVLNTFDRFAAAAFTPVLFNVTLIVVALLLLPYLPAATAIAVGAVAGGLLQWLFQVPFAWRLGMRFRPRLDLRDPALRRVGRLMVPGLFGAGVTQINILVGQLVASWLDFGSISSLYFAGRLNELTLGVFAISVATVVLPLMSRQAAAGDRVALVETLNFGLRQVTFITLPATVGLVLLRSEIVAVLFEGGEFDARSVALTAAPLWAYSVGMVGYAAVRMLAPSFYALKDTRTPVLVGAVAMLVNVAGCVVLMRPLDHAGIALANTLAGYVNAGLLLWLLRGRVGRIGGRRLLATLARLGAAAALMGWVVWGLAERWQPAAREGLPARAAVLGAVIVIGVITYLAAAAALRAPELAELRLVLSGRPGEAPGGDGPAGEAS